MLTTAATLSAACAPQTPKHAQLGCASLVSTHAQPGCASQVSTHAQLVDTAGVHARKALLSTAAAAAVFNLEPVFAETSLLPVQPYCIPGITAERCRGVFWETGKLYKKSDYQTKVLSPTEYSQALRELDGLRGELRRLGGLADDGRAGEVGASAARARAAIRQTGEQVLRSLAGDDRLDGKGRLNAVISALDDIDKEALKEPSQSAAQAAGFAPLRLMLDGAASRFDDFRAQLPAEPVDAEDVD